MKYYIGIDLGGTNIAVGIVDDEHKIILEDSVPTNCPRPLEGIADDIANLCFKLLDNAKICRERVAWAGVGSPGIANQDTGRIERAYNLGFTDAPLKHELEKRLGMTVFIENDANAAALAEVLAGAAKGASNAVVLTLGTGVGGGIIVEGKILRGFNFGGAEVGHMVIRQNGRPCSCGRRGCFEAHASTNALKQMTQECMLENTDSELWNICPSVEKVSGKTVFAAAEMGDTAAIGVLNEYFDNVACGVANMINIFQPEVLCIGGGISKEGERLLAPVRERVNAEMFNRDGEKKTKIVAAQLGNDAGIIGAALLGKEPAAAK